MLSKNSFVFSLAFALTVLALPVDAVAQNEAKQVTSLQEALKIARERNGQVRAARAQVEVQMQRKLQAETALFPTLDGNFNYRLRDQEQKFGGTSQTFKTDSGSLGVGANYRILDSGSRKFAIDLAKASFQAELFSAQDTFRQTLFTVSEQYYETLRAEQLKRLANEQVDRADLIFKQTTARVAAGDAARIDTLQAEADLLNARVALLGSDNRITNSYANLRATLGLSEDETFALTAPEPTVNPTVEVLRDVIAEGTQNRPDLLASRKRIDQERISLRQSKVNAGVSFTLDANYDFQLTPDSLGDRGVTFLASYPLFDGGRRRQAVREQEFQLKSTSFTYVQTERVAQAQIESTYKEYVQNAARFRAAELALRAAQANFEAAVNSQRLGATDLLVVSTARVSLATAESNRVEAIFDYLISEARLKLVTGRPLEGEE